MSITITPTMTLATELCAGLSAEEATRRVQAALRMGDVGARVAAFYLADLVERRAFIGLGHPTFKDFADHRLHESEGTLRRLITIGRALRELPVIDSYFAEDQLNLSQVRELVRIATPETDRPWAEWAQPRTEKEIAQKRKRLDKGDLPTTPNRRRIHEPRQRISGEANPTQYEVWRHLRAKFEAQRGSPLSDLDLLIMLAQLGLQLRPDGSVPGWTPVNDTHYLLHARVRYGGDGEVELVTADEEGDDVVLDPRELHILMSRPPHLLEPSALAGGAPVAEIDTEVVPDPENHGPLVPETLRDPPTSPDLRDQVLERDGYRCRSCSSKDNVTVHHRVWRSHGGKTTRDNLVSLCEPCHSLVHARLLIVLGEPDGELRFLDRAGLDRERVPAHPIALPIVAAPPATTRVDDEVDLERLPGEVDGEWWARHEHLFTWNERQGDLVLTPGFPQPPRQPDQPAVPAAFAAVSEGLDTLVGQTAVRDRLKAAITAVKQRGEWLGHLLFTGSPAWARRGSRARSQPTWKRHST
jgi:hypothetical protein